MIAYVKNKYRLFRYRNKSNLKLNIGCGRNVQHGYINIDPIKYPGIDLQADIEWCFKHLTGKCEEVYLSHVLEHFASPGKDLRKEKPSVLWVLSNIYKLLQVDGVIRLAVPDFNGLSEVYQKGEMELYPRLLGRICGEQNYPTNLHKCMFDKNFLTFCLKKTGFEGISEWDPKELNFNRDSSFDELEGINTSLNLMAYKRT